MKLLSLLSLISVASAFGVSPHPISTKSSGAVVDVPTSALRKDTSVASPLFRDPIKVRGGAVPGWAAYNDALDKNPLTAKACTSLFGWALGDVLAQVRLRFCCGWLMTRYFELVYDDDVNPFFCIFYHALTLICLSVCLLNVGGVDCTTTCIIYFIRSSFREDPLT